jgi:hypothetical protein
LLLKILIIYKLKIFVLIVIYFLLYVFCCLLLEIYISIKMRPALYSDAEVGAYSLPSVHKEQLLVNKNIAVIREVLHTQNSKINFVLHQGHNLLVF